MRSIACFLIITFIGFSVKAQSLILKTEKKIDVDTLIGPTVKHLWSRSDEVLVVKILSSEALLWSSDASNYYVITCRIEERLKWKQISKDSTIVRFTEKVSWPQRGTETKSLLLPEKKYIVFLTVRSSYWKEVNGVPDNKTLCSLIEDGLGVQEFNEAFYKAVRLQAYSEKWISKY